MQAPWKSERNQAGAERGRRTFLWEGLLSALLLCWSLMVLREPWGSLKPGLLSGILTAVVVWLLCAAAERDTKTWLKGGLWLLPWLAVLPWAGEIRQGVLLWSNCVLTLWNAVHQSALALFRAEATTQSVTVCAVAASIGIAQLIWQMTVRRNLTLGGVCGLLLALLQLLTGTFSPLAWGLWFSAFLGIWMSGEVSVLPRQLFRIWGIVTAAFLLCALPGAETELSGVTRLRETAAQTIEELRYGRNPLPEGDLNAAAKLKQGEDEVIRVQAEEEKSLYLRAFVGAEYGDSQWTALPASAYGGTYTGMLNWLRKQGFDPLTQSASYYALCDADTAPEVNRISVQVTGGTRAYLYAPASMEAVSASVKEKQDLRLLPRGLRGADSYTVEERSLSRPAELTVWADWVAAPETEAQSRYVQAEGMYRSFVYDNDTRVDAELAPLLQGMFWEGYENPSHSVYSALDRIRTVLQEQTEYTDEPEAAPDGTDAIADFLTGSRKGNAVLYASAAVEALRAAGIPARYVEGYYVSASALADSADGTVSLTGQDAHAWAEVYFDGVGWLAVDVTPGYYYDAVTLEQMVGLPEDVKKTAAVEEGDNGTESVAADLDTSDRRKTEEIIRDTALSLLGLAAIGVLVLTGWFLIRRLRHFLRVERERRQYLRADASGRIWLLKKWIYAELAAGGIDACLGWKTKETDQEAAERFLAVEPGDYARVVELLEKFGYGQTELAPFEVRVLETFLKKLKGADR